MESMAHSEVTLIRPVLLSNEIRGSMASLQNPLTAEVFELCYDDPGSPLGRLGTFVRKDAFLAKRPFFLSQGTS
jgi:hypothetical protein